MMKKVFFSFFFALIVFSVFAQIDYNKQYNNAKALFRDGKYNLAMESFKPLIPYDQKNSYSEYASLYYAVSAYHQGYKAVTKNTLNQIKTLYPNWDKLSEVNFWLAKVHFDNRDYFQALKVLSYIQDKKFEKDIEALKQLHLPSVVDLETLRMMFEEYPKDAIVARSLATALSKNLDNEEDKKKLEELIDHFKLKRSDLIPEAPKTFYKERYAVSVMMPFMVGQLEPTLGKKRNQIVLDFYEGLKLAADTLSKQNILISLRAYDCDRNVEKLKQLLDTEELKNTDVIVGPFFPEENKVVQGFSLEYKINIIHPLSNSAEIIGNNPFAFLFQPSAETIGKESADYIADHAKEKTCMIFYGSNKKDSVMAANFYQQASGKGLTVLASERIFRDELRRVSDILETATEKDEFGYPSEFTLKKDSVSNIFVASDDPLIYSRVVSAVETRKDSILVIGSENWVDDHAIDLDKYQTLGIVLVAPNFVNPHKPHYRAFERAFIKHHGKVPSGVARMGYEFMLFLGNQLKTNGVYFQEGLSKAGVLPGYLGEGFDYQNGRDNQLIPFTTFKNGEVILIEKR